AQRHAGAGAGERLGDLPSDAARGAGDEGTFAAQIKHLSGPLPELNQAPLAAMKASMSAGVPMAVPLASGAMRLASPVSTLPVPSSSNSPTPPSPVSQPTQSVQRTMPVTCSTRRLRISEGSLMGRARTLATSGT